MIYYKRPEKAEQAKNSDKAVAQIASALAQMPGKLSRCAGCREAPSVENPMKCLFCEQDARGCCAACGRGVCRQHAHLHDEMTLAKSDTSTGYTSYYNVYGALKCSECRLEWLSFRPGQ